MWMGDGVADENVLDDDAAENHNAADADDAGDNGAAGDSAGDVDVQTVAAEYEPTEDYHDE